MLARHFRRSVLLRQKYGTHDYRRYDGDVARELGQSGVPVELLVLCKLHPVQTTAIVKSWDEARDAVENGRCLDRVELAKN